MECGRPVCPKCLVRTDVGTKCQTCASPAEVRVTRIPGGRKRWVFGGAGVVVAVVAIVVAVLLVGSSKSTPPATNLGPIGTWANQSPLSTIRGTTAIVTLNNGMVLAAGGGDGQVPVAATELYNPSNGSWNPTGALNVARRGATATLLGNGDVLIVGGISGSAILSSAELYNPSTGTWSNTGSMLLPLLDNTLTELPNGEVLATGGTTTNGTPGTGAGQTITPTNTAELYNPTTGTWSMTGQMSSSRFEATASLLPGGKVLVVGGLGGPGQQSPTGLEYPTLNTAEIYDPAVGVFAGAGQMATPRADQVAAVLPNGTVMVAGGVTGPEGLISTGTVEDYNPTTGAWQRLPEMTPRAGASAAILPGGAVLVAGGETVNQGSTSSLASAEVFNPSGDTWRSAGNMSCARSGLSAASLQDGSALEVAGDSAFPGQPPVAQGCVDRYYPAH